MTRGGRYVAGGFTLIEVLVVMAVLGVALGMVAVNLTRDTGSLLEDDARRLALLLEYARDEAVTQGRPVAWSAGPTGYAFARNVRGRGWVSLDDAKDGEVLRSRTWPAEVSLASFRIAGVNVERGEPLVFSSSGFNPPYDLVLASGAWRVALSGDLSGKVKLERARKTEGDAP